MRKKNRSIGMSSDHSHVIFFVRSIGKFGECFVIFHALYFSKELGT